jgi:hypothetical protein
MIIKITTYAFVAVVAVVAFLFLSDITRKDVIAANVATLQNALEPLSAGDIVMVSSRGQMSRLCNAAVAPGGLEKENRSELYFNRVMRVLISGVEMAEGFGFLKDGQTENMILRRDLPFIGESSCLMGTEYTYANPEACDCAVARTLSRGHKACNVSASLIETSEGWRAEDGKLFFRPVRRSIAVNLNRHVLYLPEAVFAKCNVPYSDEARVAMQTLCSDDESLPLDVKLRQMLNLIDSEPLEVAAVLEN